MIDPKHLTGPHPVDVVVPIAPKDYLKMPYFIEGVKEHITPDTIHIITPDPGAVGREWEGVVFHSDDEAFPYDRQELYHNRRNWIWQMIAKVFQDVTENDWYIVMDGDIVPNNTIPIWTEEGRPIFCMGRKRQMVPAYFKFNQAMFGFGQVHSRSFLTECVLYSKQLVREMIAFCGCANLDAWWAKCVEITNTAQHFADAEFYGSYIWHEHRDVYEFRDIVSVLGGKYDPNRWTDEAIQNELSSHRKRNPKAHLISLHTWQDWQG